MEEGSAISPEWIASSGARSIESGRELPPEFSQRQRRRGGGILFPVHRPNGKTSWSFRPDKPRPDKPNHKYEAPCKALGGAGNVLGILPSQRHLIKDPSVPVIFVEGQKKQLALLSAASAASETVLVVAIIGVWNWLHNGGEPIPDMQDIPLEGRNVTVMFDSDVLYKAPVQMAASRLAEYSQGRGANTFMTFFRDLAGGRKCGADDFFVSGGTFSKLRLLTRKYDPRDFAHVRLSRDPTLSARIGELVRSFWTTAWKRQGGHTDRDMALVLIKSAAQCGRPVRGGVYVPKSWAELQLEVKTGPRTVSKSLARLESIGFIARRVKGEKPHKHGGFVLASSEAANKSAGVYQLGTERAAEEHVTNLLHAVYAATIHPRASRLMWSSPGSKGRRGTVKGTRKVRQSKPPERKPPVKRPGKVRGALIDVLDAFERSEERSGRFTLEDLCQALHRKRPRDLIRRKRPGSKGRDGLLIMLLDADVVRLDGEIVSLAADWRERLDDLRRAGREIDSRVVLTRSDGSTTEHVVEGDETIAGRRMKIKREEYRDFLRKRRELAKLRAAGRSQEQRSEATKTSKASEEAIRCNHEARERGMEEERRRKEREASARAKQNEEDRAKRRRVDRLKEQGMSETWAEAEVYDPGGSPFSRTDPHPSLETAMEASLDPEPSEETRKMPRMVEGVYVHGPECDCWWCDEGEGGTAPSKAYATTRRGAA